MFGSCAQLQSLPIGDTLSDSTADAVLLIGDRAIQSPPGSFAEVWDLGDRWRRWSGLPFVFAMWVARAGIELGSLEAAFAEARDEGLAHLEQIAEAEGALRGLTVPQCTAYFRDNLHFHLGRQEMEGLRLFYRHASELDLAPRGFDVGRLVPRPMAKA